MSDKIESRQKQQLPSNHTENPTEGPAVGPHQATDHVSEEPAQINLSIFDERYAKFTDGLAKTCTEEGVKLAMAMIIDPMIKEGPILFLLGPTFDLALMAKDLADNLKFKVMKALE